MNRVEHIFKDSLIKQQAKAEQEMLRELEAGNYTLQNPLVKYNPYFISPLSAVVLFCTEEEVAVTLTVRGKESYGDISHTFPKAKTHVLPVLGLYNDYENQVELYPYHGEATVITIRTPDVFDGKSVCYSMKTTPQYLMDQIIFLSPAEEDLAVGFDYAGDARWHLNVPCIFDMKRTACGHILIGTNRLIHMPYHMSGIYEMDLAGKIYKEFRLPGGYHHDQIEMPDGNLLIQTNDLSGQTTEDVLVLVDRETGDILKTWDYNDFLVHGMGKSGGWRPVDWFHNNAVWYDPNTDTLTLSGRHMDAIVNIDYNTGALNWIIGDPDTWPEDWVDKYFFTPVGTGFEWQYEQHACVVTPNGDILCFDNHQFGAKRKENFKTAKDSYSRGVRYRIDTEKMTIEQVWEFGKERGADFYSPYISNVEYYGEGHYMIHSGGIAYLNGEPSDVLGAFLKNHEGGQTESRTVEVYGDKIMMELHVPGNFYRAEKMRLYYEGENLTLGEGRILGQMGVTKEFDTEIPAAFTGEMLPESCAARVEEEEDRIVFYSRFEKGQLVMLLLEQGEEVHRYFISTAATNRNQAMCCGTFLETDERNTKTFVNKAGLSGAYQVRVIIDDIKYETGVEIVC